MTYTIRDNNGNIVCSVENTTTLSYESINNEIDSINKYSDSINKSIEAFNFISDTRAMEALGYRATEGFGDKIKSVGKGIYENIKKFFSTIYNFIKDLILKIKLKMSNLNKQQYKSKLFIDKLIKNLKTNIKSHYGSSKDEAEVSYEKLSKMYNEFGFDILIKFINSKAADNVASQDILFDCDSMMETFNKTNKAFNDLIDKYRNDFYDDNVSFHMTNVYFEEELDNLENIGPRSRNSFYDSLDNIRKIINDENIINVFNKLDYGEHKTVAELLERTYNFLDKYNADINKNYISELNEALSSIDKAWTHADKMEQKKHMYKCFDKYVNLCRSFWFITHKIIIRMNDILQTYIETISIFGK